MFKVFFDASVIFSACQSPSGGSRRLVDFVRYGHILGITSQTVIEEVERNASKFSVFSDLASLINDNNFFVRSKITLLEIKPYQNLIEPKDAHVVAGAVLTECDYLVTLDKKHLDNTSVKNSITQTKIVSPKDLLEVLAEKLKI